MQSASAGVVQAEEATARQSPGSAARQQDVHTVSNLQPAQESRNAQSASVMGSAATAQGSDSGMQAGDSGFASLPRKLATIVSGESAPATPSAEEMASLETQVQGIARRT